MSYYVADVGEVIIKPEFRKDFGHLFRCEYGSIKAPLLVDFIIEYLSRGDEIRVWKHKDGIPVSYDEERGVFRYGVTYYHEGRLYENIVKLLYRIIPDMAKEIVFMNNFHDGNYFNDSGEVIIHPEFREDFGHLFRWEYYKLNYKPLTEWANPESYSSGQFIELRYWRHCDEKDEWKDRYKTSYNEATGLFVYGVCYNLYTRFGLVEFTDDILPAITEGVISEDGWAES